MTTSAAPIAAFDFDGTLTTGDCMMPFLRRVAGTRRVATAVARIVPLAARRERDAAKAQLLAELLSGVAVAAAADTGERFASEIVARRLRRDTVSRLRWHQSRGHRTVIVSASLRPYLQPVAAHLGVDHVICTELGETEGRYTGRILDGNCRGPAKADRLLAWAGVMPGELWAYGDSAGDAELLALAHHAERLGRRRTIAAHPPATAVAS